MSEPNLDHFDGYLAVYAFLDLLWGRNDPSREELGMMLGAMSLLRDGMAADQGCVQDWDEAHESATGRRRGKFSPSEIYRAMLALLRTYAGRGAIEEFGQLIERLDTAGGTGSSPADPQVERDWAGCVAAARAGQVDALLRLNK